MFVPPVAKSKGKSVAGSSCRSVVSHRREVEGQRPFVNATLRRAANGALRHAQEVLQSPGAPLDGSSRAYFEPRFGRDFSMVRTHSDAKAATSAGALSALAYTVGQHIVFGKGAPDRNSSGGRTLLAHELTHVVQQGGGSAPPGPAQERDAEDASQAVELGNRPAVRKPSGVGIARQHDPGASGAALPELPEAGLKIVRLPDIKARVARIWASPAASVVQGRADFNASPARAKANLYQTHFRSDDERLSYALGVFQAYLGSADAPADRDELFVMLADYEVQVQRQAADIVIHSPPTRAETQRIRELRAERERREYDYYMSEVARIKHLEEQAANARTVRGGGWSGAATLGLYEFNIGLPIQMGLRELTEADYMPLIRA